MTALSIPELRLQLGGLLAAAGRTDEALAELEGAWREFLDPSLRAEAGSALAGLVAQSDPRRAFALYVESAATDPAHADRFLPAARSLLAVSSHLAESQCVAPGWDKGVDDDIPAPARAALHEFRGQLALVRGDAVSAKSEFDKAVALNPHADGALTGLGELALDSGDTDGAIAFLQSASTSLTSLGGTGLRALAHRVGDRLLEAESYELIIDQLTPVADSGNDDPSILRYLVAALIGGGRNADALTHLDKIEAPTAALLALRAQALVASGSYIDAIAAARAATAAEPANVDAHLVLAQVLIESGEWPNAREAVDIVEGLPIASLSSAGPSPLRLARAARPNDMDLAYLAAAIGSRAILEPMPSELQAERLVTVQNDLRMAFDHGCADRPVAAFAHLLDAELRQRAGDVSGAAAARHAAGLEFRNRDDYPSALEPLSLAHDMDPDRAETAWLLADTLLVIGWRTYPADAAMINRAIEIWDANAPQSTPPEELRWIHLTRAHLASLAAQQPSGGNWLHWQALAYFETALALNPDRVDCWSRLVEECNTAALYQVALEVADEALRIDEHDLVCLQEISAILANLGRPAESLTALSRYREALDGRTANEIYLEKITAFCHVQVGELDVADDHLATILAVEPTEEWAVPMRARVRDRRGDRTAAQWFRELLEDVSDTPTRRQNRALASLALRRPQDALAILGGLSDPDPYFVTAVEACLGQPIELERLINRSNSVKKYPPDFQDYLADELRWAERAAVDAQAAAAVGKLRELVRSQLDAALADSPSVESDLLELCAQDGTGADWARFLADLIGVRRARALSQDEFEQAIDRLQSPERPRPDMAGLARQAIDAWRSVRGAEVDDPAP